jgi:hypothetical protein
MYELEKGNQMSQKSDNWRGESMASYTALE